MKTAIVSMVATLALGACTASSVGQLAPTDALVAVSIQNNDDAYDAMTSGRLAQVGPCLKLVSGASMYTLLLPRGARISSTAAGLTIIMPNSDSGVSMGDTVNVGGGEVSMERLATLELEPKLPSECGAPFWSVSSLQEVSQ